VMCETCDTWYHIHCQNINDSTYERLGSTSVAWVCLKCNGPNYSTILFDLHGLEATNRFSTLSDTSSLSIDSVDLQALNQPKHASSPIHPRPQAAKCARPLRIINVNCQSLVNKKGPFYNLLDSSRPDVIIATETWLHDGILSSEYFSSDHYTIYRRDRNTDTSGGGVLIAVNRDIMSTREETLEVGQAEMIWVKVTIKGCKNLYICGCYRAESGDADFVEAFNTSLERIAGSTNNMVIAGGDFNFPGWDWRDNTLKPRTQFVALHNKFGDILNDFGLTQIVTEPTRFGNILDLIITNRPNQVHRTQILPGISDHNVVYTEFDVNPMRKKQTARKIPLLNKADWEGFKQFTGGLLYEMQSLGDFTSVEELWLLFKCKIQEGINKFIPFKNAKTKESCPWVRGQLKRKIRRRDKAFPILISDPWTTVEAF